MAREGANKNLGNARRAKNDEFYTQYGDIQKEIEKYLDYNPNTFNNKVVYCNCDNPFESNFFRYFVLNFNNLKLKQVIFTSFNLNNKFIINEVLNIDIDNDRDLKDVVEQLKANKKNEWTPLEGDGDFRSDECISLLKQSDIVVTNPPFSLFREYVQQLFDYNKKFLIIGNINCLTYKEIFPKIKQNKAWLGNGMGRWISGFVVPESYDLYGSEARIDKNGNRIVATNNCLWLTNLKHGRRHQSMPLMTMADNLKFSKHKEIKGKQSYDKYDNYDAIEVPFTDAIPSDYDGVMGVPITFLDKYNPEQFEILGITNITGEREHLMNNIKCSSNSAHINGKPLYARILIKTKK